LTLTIDIPATKGNLTRFDGQFVIVERSGEHPDVFIGTAEVDTAKGEVTIRSGHRGRPAVLPFADVDGIATV
jgi:hypothetical protein